MRMEDHLLQWKLFCTNAGNIVHSCPPIRKAATDLVECCGGNLTAINLVARAMRDVSDVNVWIEALSNLEESKLSRLGILKAAVKLVSKRRGWNAIVKHCIVESLSDFQWVDRKSLMARWRTKDITQSDEQELYILNDLIDALLFDSSGEPDVTRVTPELHGVLSSIFELGPIVFHGSTGRLPKDSERDCRELHLNCIDLSELPANPSCCSALQKLFLQDNHVLTVIPPCFFESMKVLKLLNLSNTSIKKLPESFFNLTTLTELVLRGCRLFMELPPQIGHLHSLEVLDLEGTEIIQLPVEVKNLINLTCLILTFHGYGKLPEQMIPADVLVKLNKLTQLSIDVNPDDERWEKDVKIVIREVIRLKQLRNVKLYLPQVYYLREHFPSLIFRNYHRFHFTVGSHFRRIMSWTQLGVEAEFQKRSRCLRYVHGSEVPAKSLSYALQRTKAFFLDRHQTVTKLSQFGTENMKQIEFCVLGECSELQTIVEEGPQSRQGDCGEEEQDIGKEDGKNDSSTLTVEPVLESLEHLIVYNMENLRNIWISKATIHHTSLCLLKSLRLHSCPQLSTIFSVALLGNLGMLEELIMEDCESVQRLVDPCPQSSNLSSETFLPKLKRVSLHYLPELVSISSGLHIAPNLERMSFYNCPKLKSLSTKEVSSNRLRKIRGKKEWWLGLQWNEAEWKEGLPSNLANVFIPFKETEDLMTQLEEDENSS